MLLRRMSIGHIVIATLVIVTTLLLGSFFIARFTLYRKAQWAHLHRDQTALVEQLSASLTLPIWNFDHEQIDKILESAMADNNVYAVSVKLTDTKGTIQAQSRSNNWRIIPVHVEHSDNGFLVQKRDIVFLNETIGTVKTLTTPQFVMKDLRSQLYSLAFITLALDLIIILSLYMLLHYMVLRPLQAVEQYAVAASGGNTSDLVAPKGRFVGELRSLRDSITETIRLLDARYAALMESEERFCILVEQAPDAIVVYDVDLERFIDANPKAEELFGCSREEIMHSSPQRFQTDEGSADLPTASRLQEHIDRVLAGETEVFQQTVCSNTGQVLICEVRLVQLPAADRNLIRASFVDITNRIRAEQQLQQIMAELARSNKDLEQFAYAVSHDLQEPLRMITSYLELLKRRFYGNLSEEANDFIDYAVDGATRMKELITDILAYSRAGVSSQLRELVRMENILDEVFCDLGLPDSGQVEITHDPLPVVYASHTHMMQLLCNLIGNGIKFRKESGVHIHISATQEGRDWVFSVRDDGIGIDPQHHEAIFRIFQRLHGRGRYQGSGVGLALCKRIVEQNGGRIWVESEPGKGSTFFFTIPNVSL